MAPNPSCVDYIPHSAAPSDSYDYDHQGGVRYRVLSRGTLRIASIRRPYFDDLDGYDRDSDGNDDNGENGGDAIDFKVDAAFLKSAFFESDETDADNEGSINSNYLYDNINRAIKRRRLS
uniref:Uncharacterized protein n=1 Tax=Tetranychus urticae TaxID=32264 RepID=T1JS93_TETUR